MAFLASESLHELHARTRELWKGTQNFSFRVAKSHAEEPEIPSPAIFDILDGNVKRGTADGSIPSVAQCAVHLELLEAFKVLRETVLKSNQLDVLFDTLPIKTYTTQYTYRRRRYVPRKRLRKPLKESDTTYFERRHAKWTAFANYAFQRFSIWAGCIERTAGATARKRRHLIPSLVPPLDVLMVWHALLMEPRFCLLWCQRHGISWITDIDFPWRHIHEMIGSDRKFSLPPENAASFERNTILKPDLLDSLVKGQGDRLTMGARALGSSLTATRKSKESGTDFGAHLPNHDAWVDRMCHFLWIRSPALEFTLTNAQKRYRQFFELLSSPSDASFTPTPDIELVWLTHQCSPKSFGDFSTATVGYIIERNIDASVRNDQNNSRATEEAFQAKFGVEFKHCLCWECQSLERLGEENIPSEADVQRALDEALQQIEFFRAVERARRKREMLPMKNKGRKLQGISILT